MFNFDVSQIDFVSDKGTTPTVDFLNKRQTELLFIDKRIYCLKSKPTILLNLVVRIIGIVKLVCQSRERR